jgi:hypothetical protein
MELAEYCSSFDRLRLYTADVSQFPLRRIAFDLSPARAKCSERTARDLATQCAKTLCEKRAAGKTALARSAARR